jgi:hypothetical protein
LEPDTGDCPTNKIDVQLIAPYYHIVHNCQVLLREYGLFLAKYLQLYSILWTINDQIPLFGLEYAAEAIIWPKNALVIGIINFLNQLLQIK